MNKTLNKKKGLYSLAKLASQYEYVISVFQESQNSHILIMIPTKIDESCSLYLFHEQFLKKNFMNKANFAVSSVGFASMSFCSVEKQIK